MDARITVAGGDDPVELADLERCLAQNDSLRQAGLRRERQQIGQDDMGALSDVLLVAAGSGGLGAALATSLSVWLRTRVGHLSVKLHTERGELEIDARSAQDVAALADAVSRLVDDSGVAPS